MAPPGNKQTRGIKSIRTDIAETLVAFANADGGELLVGVEDGGDISGLDHFSEQQVDLLFSAPKHLVLKKTPLSQVDSREIEINGNRIIYFSIQKGTRHVHLTADGRCLIRRDLETIPVSAEEISFSRAEQSSREYDRSFLDGANVSDLNRDLLQVVATQIEKNMSHEKCIQYLNLGEFSPLGTKLRRAALLLFAKDPMRWHPRLQIRIVRVHGIELKSGADFNVASDHTVSGNVIELVEKGWEALRPELVQTRLGRDAKFNVTVMYPELACREALVNAIAHRDYSVEGQGIEIFVYDDRMEVRNPGSLLSSISIDDLVQLKGVHQSRNALVSRVLRELGYMQELGEGMRRMFELMALSDLRSPEIRSENNAFAVTLKHETVYSPRQRLWLDNFSELELSREEKAVVAMGMDGAVISTQEIIDNLGIVDLDHYRSLVFGLQQKGIFKRVLTKTQAFNQARKMKMPKRAIPCFQIIPPNVELATNNKNDEPESGVVEDEEAFDYSARLFVGNVDPLLSDEGLITYFSNFGSVVYLKVPRFMGRGKGYAFVEFSTREEAINALFSMPKKLLNGRRVDPKKYIPNN